MPAVESSALPLPAPRIGLEMVGSFSVKRMGGRFSRLFPDFTAVKSVIPEWVWRRRGKEQGSQA